MTEDERQPGDLSEHERFLLRSLDDLDAEWANGDISDEDYAELKRHYQFEAARLLRGEGGPADEYIDDLDDLDDLPHRRRVWPVRVIAVLLVLALALGSAWAVVAAMAGERLPGEGATGDIDLSTDDLLARARAQVGRGEALEAIKTYDQVLAVDASNVEALAYRGWLLRLAGLSEEGLAYIDRAIAADARYPDAHFFRGMILFEDQGRAAEGAAELKIFLASNPPAGLAEMVREVLARAEAAR